MTQTLGEVVAIEKAARQTANKRTGELFKLAQKVPVFFGLRRAYTPKDDDGLQLPPEGNIVQQRVPDLMEHFRDALGLSLDLAATKDSANTSARADVVVGGEVILENVPVSHLLFLEHQLTDVRAFVGALPILTAEDTWTFNSQTGLSEADPVRSHRNEKHEVPLVLFPATKDHPAQVKTTMEETYVGYWTNVKLSGAIPAERKRELLNRVDYLMEAVKIAREQANQVAAPRVFVAEHIFGFLFA